MKKFTKGILIFALLLFIGGSGCLIAGFVMGITSGDLERAINELPFIDFEHQIIFKGEDIFAPSDTFDKVSPVGGSQSFFKEEVTSMELDLASVNCRIYPAEGDEIIITTSDNSNVRVMLKGNRLEIENTTDVFKQNDETIDVYLPEDLHLTEFEIQAGAGNIVIDSPIHADMISMEIGGSSVHVNGKITAENLDVELGAGMATFELVDAIRISLENGVGQTNLGLVGQRDKYNVTIESAAGSVQYGDEAFSGLADTYKNQPKDADRSIQIESALGQVAVTFREEI